MEQKVKNNIILYLSQFVAISEVNEINDELIIRGHRIQEYSLKQIRRKLRAIIGSIHEESTIAGSIFYVKPAKKRIYINVILFFITILSTLFVGSIMEGADPIKNPYNIIKGFPFSFTLMLILGVHEFGHYYFAKKHDVDASLPYFIPAPTLIGTFGAFIKMRSPVKNRRALTQIGAAGPIAGFCVAVPAFYIGLKLSHIVDLPTATEGIILGDSIITKFLTFIVYPNLKENMDIMLNPIAFAAWIGMIVTMLNLLPIGQLDGGHVAYGILGKKHKHLAWTVFGLILVLGLIPMFFKVYSLNWIIWMVLVFFLVKIKHPPVFNEYEKISKLEIILGVISLLILILTFIPIPIRI